MVNLLFCSKTYGHKRMYFETWF